MQKYNNSVTMNSFQTTEINKLEKNFHKVSLNLAQLHFCV